MTERVPTRELIEKGYLVGAKQLSERNYYRKLSSLLADCPTLKGPEEGYPHVGSVIEEVNVINIRPFAYGGMGTTYLSIQHPEQAGKLDDLQRLAMSKYMRPIAKADKILTERYIREGSVGNKIKHPGVPSLIYNPDPEAIRAGENLPIIVKYVIGAKTLTELIRKTDMQEKIEIITKGVSVLSEIHEQTSNKGEKPPIMHRDLKPENMLARISDMSFYFIDWGLASDPDEPAGKIEEEEDTRLTIKGQPMGTPRYMSKEEVIKGKRAYDMRNEVYSLGSTFYHFLTGKPPYKGETTMDILMQIASGQEPREPHIINPDIPLEVSRVLSKAMSVEPEDRFQNMKEFYHALEEARAPIKTTTNKSTFIMPEEKALYNEPTEPMPTTKQPTILSEETLEREQRENSDLNQNPQQQ